MTLSHRRKNERRVPPRSWALLAVSLATFMTYLDNNIINVAIPTIQHSLHLNQSGIEWVVSGYILVFAALLLAGGRLADFIGNRLVFAVGLAIFTVSSLAAGLAGSVSMLIASRATQGLGAALVTPTALSIIAASYPGTGERLRAMGIWSAVGALALATGPILGGFLSQDVSWHWIFYVNVPVGIVTLALGLWALPGHPAGASRASSLDWPGVISSGLALAALTYALIEGPQIGWTDERVLGSFWAALVAGVVFLLVERRTGDPMVDLRIFRDPMFTGSVIAVMLWAFGLFGIYFYTSLYLQNVLGFGAVEAGAAFLPMALLMAAAAGVSDRVAARFGAQRSVGWAMVLMGIGIASVSLLGAHASFAELMPGLIVIGVGGGLTIPLTATVVGVLPAERAGVASGLFNASRELAGLLGVTIIGVILTTRMHAVAHGGATPVSAFLSGYRLALIVAGALVAAGGLAAWWSLRQATQIEVTGPQLAQVA
jgi:EmrB/QacA subfamily drug resistance transporter